MLIGSVLLTLLGVESSRKTNLGSAIDYLPMEKGTRWSYEVFAGEVEFRLDTRRYGGDVRFVEGRGRVPYDFVFGKRPSDKHGLTKSIYQASRYGSRLFYFDAFQWRVEFEPPLKLLPRNVSIDARWKWKGEISVDGEKAQSSAQLKVVGVEEISVPAGVYQAVHVTQVHQKPGLTIHRWFAQGVGLIKEDQILRKKKGEAARRGLRLLSFASK